MSDLSVFSSKVLEKNINYYVFPVNYPLFKANKILDRGSVVSLKPNRPYFFGLKNVDPEYIEDYEREYGVIFEFVTTRVYKLLALDDKLTQTTLYNDAPEDIQIILESNYGFNTGIRNSVSEPDRIISDYICSLGYDGYAINYMKTDNIGGTFHPELMICNSDGIQYVGKVTPDSRVESIIERGKIDRLSSQLKESRKNKRSVLSSPKKLRRLTFGETNNNNNNNNNNNPNVTPTRDQTQNQTHNANGVRQLDFVEDDEDNIINSKINFDEFGGTKRKSKLTKKARKSNKRTSKRSSKRRVKTNKRRR
jgi:hypothetical protein